MCVPLSALSSPQAVAGCDRVVTSKNSDVWAAATFLPYTRLCLNPENSASAFPGAGAAELAGPGGGAAAAQLQRAGRHRCVLGQVGLGQVGGPGRAPRAHGRAKS